jgi:hypothetical protein
LPWSFGNIIGVDGARLDALFVEEFDGRDEEVHEQSPLGGVEVVEHGDDGGVVKSLVAEILSDVRPVLPFDVRVVVLGIFP